MGTSWPPYYTVSLAFLLDQLLGDPHFRLHPVRLIGDTAEFLRARFYPWGKIGGFLTAGFSALVWLFLAWGASHFWPLEAILLYFWLAESALRREVIKVYHPLKEGLLEVARRRLSFLVGRETKSISVSQCVRAAVETVAENFTDALVGPLFWYLLFVQSLVMA